MSVKAISGISAIPTSTLTIILLRLLLWGTSDMVSCNRVPCVDDVDKIIDNKKDGQAQAKIDHGTLAERRKNKRHKYLRRVERGE